MQHHAVMLPSAPASKDSRIVIGTMTGTSLDGDIDIAAIRVDGHGYAIRARFLAGHSHPLGRLVEDLRRAAQQEPMTAREFARVAQAFGEAHASAITTLCARLRLTPDLVTLHGQTVYHAPPLSWQLMNPWPVACAMRCRVRFDLRAANLASGGEGAPITPLADHFLFHTRSAPTAVLNLGGFANATLLAPDTNADARLELPHISGFDVCPCNHLLNRVAQDRLGKAFDADGGAARTGKSDAAALGAVLEAMRASTRASAAARRSLGTGDEAASIVRHTAHLAPNDACRTVSDAVAQSIVSALREAGVRDEHALLLAGGSTRHQPLVQAIASARSGQTVDTMASHGVPIDMREAAGIAVLGALADDGVSYCLDAVVGAKSRALDSACIEPN